MHDSGAMALKGYRSFEEMRLEIRKARNHELHASQIYCKLWHSIIGPGSDTHDAVPLYQCKWHMMQNFPTRLEGKPMLPLPADHPITVQDMGNASPRAMRMTLNCVPSSGDLLQSCNMPFAVSVQPLAPPLPGDSPLQACSLYILRLE